MKKGFKGEDSTLPTIVYSSTGSEYLRSYSGLKFLQFLIQVYPSFKVTYVWKSLLVYLVNDTLKLHKLKINVWSAGNIKCKENGVIFNRKESARGRYYRRG